MTGTKLRARKIGHETRGWILSPFVDSFYSPPLFLPPPPLPSPLPPL